MFDVDQCKKVVNLCSKKSKDAPRKTHPKIKVDAFYNGDVPPWS
jgi:hypothetical protein